MRALVFDLVVDRSRGRACATGVVTSGSAAALAGPAWPPDPRFANARSLRGSIEDLLTALGAPPVHVAYRLFDTHRERSDAVVLDLLEWHIASAIVDGEAVGSVVVSDRNGARGKGAFLPLQVGGGDVARVVSRYCALAAKAGLNEPVVGGAEIAIYGVPATRPEHALARLLAAALLEEGEGDLRARHAWLKPAPDGTDLAALRRLGTMVAQGETLDYGVASLKVAFDRRGGDARHVGSAWASRVLDRAWEAEPDPATRAADAACLRRALGQIAGVLDARGGDYEAAEEILARAFAPHGGQGRSWIDSVLEDDPFALGCALRLRANVANHRGDGDSAGQAISRALESVAGEVSIRTTVFRLECLILWAVACQDSWPYAPPGEAEPRRMRDVATLLEQAVAQLQELVGVLPPAAAPPLALSGRLDLGTLGREPNSATRDPTLGAALGTLGRTWAFLGDHDAAVHTLLSARSQFTSTLDRSVNSVFLAHVELDRGPNADADRLERIMATLLTEQDRSPDYTLQRLEAADIGFRFTLDVVLKSLAFALPLRGAEATAWADALAPSDDLFARLEAMPSHPTEMVARHAGEVLLRAGEVAAARRWFALGIHVAQSGGPSMRRAVAFTRKLADEGAVAPAGPRGCLTNPCYAQR